MAVTTGVTIAVTTETPPMVTGVRVRTYCKRRLFHTTKRRHHCHHWKPRKIYMAYRSPFRGVGEVMNGYRFFW